MKGKTLVIGIIIFVLVVVGVIYFAMMSTINKIKEENDLEEAAIVSIKHEEPSLTLVIQ